MQRTFKRCCAAALFLAYLAGPARGQKTLTWQQVRAEFQLANPTLQAGQIGIEESRAQEVTAFLRPNPTLGVVLDQIDPFPGGPSHGPFAFLLSVATLNYLHERQHKRELRLESAQKATGIAESGQADLERSLVFTLRMAFVQTLQEKAVLDLAKENLKYYDHVLGVNGDRFRAGAIARVDLDRLELQRVQYESDVQTAEVNLRTAKIQLLTLLNDRTPIDQFDVSGLFDFRDQLMPQDEVRKIALDTRPDLKAAFEAVDKAETDHKLAIANGSTDPILSAWYTHNGSFNNPSGINTLGVSVSIPLRIFDRNQGEKLRTQLDIDLNQKLTGAAQALVFSDVDSAYAIVNSNLLLLQPYKAKYLQQAVRVRDTVFFAYQHGGASLVDFLNAQSEYRTVELSYLNLIGSYLTAAAQLNLAVGREVLQ